MQQIINELTTTLLEGELWHEQAEMSSISMGFRGLARWHCAEAEGDAKFRRCISKCSVDLLGIVPWPTAPQTINANFTDRNGLEGHLQAWINREKQYIQKLKVWIADLSSKREFTIYKELCCHLTEVENELLYVRILANNLSWNQWGPHHITQVMKELHKYFEHDYDGGTVDFTIT